MQFRVKIFGAGSIGNHLANAARELKWSVDVCDVDQVALDRMKYQLYPRRYGQWDSEIGLFLNQNAPVGGYDLICVGTPPNSHVDIARKAIAEKPRGIMIEKPLSTPELQDLDKLIEEAAEAGIPVFCGYDHVLGDAARKMVELIRLGGLGDLRTLDVEFREDWTGIFAAHFWLNGPEDSYLGYSEQGGGALGEHSHALNFWQFLAHEMGAGRITEVDAMLNHHNNLSTKYDFIACLNLRTESGFVGRVVQDVITSPAKKWARLQAESGFLEWHCGYKQGFDAVLQGLEGRSDKEFMFKKTRSDDFKAELSHIALALDENFQSPISLHRGLETMLVISAAYLSSESGRKVSIDYTKGFNKSALSQ